jgi:hypothetical protein
LVVRRVGNVDGGITDALRERLGRGRFCAVEVAMKACTGEVGEREPLPQGEVLRIQTYSRRGERRGRSDRYSADGRRQLKGAGGTHGDAE